MEDTALSARLRFLHSSATFYAEVAPSTAAHLTLQHIQVANETERKIDKSLAANSCVACGSRLVKDLVEQSSRASDNHGEQPSTIISVKGETLSYDLGPGIKCSICHRVTKTSMQMEKAKSQSRVDKAGSQTKLLKHKTRTESDGAASSSATPRPDASTNISSKQRTKIRKKGGLRAIVDRSKRSQNPTTALDLLDLMRED